MKDEPTFKSDKRCNITLNCHAHLVEGVQCHYNLITEQLLIALQATGLLQSIR